jgi:hypothetical protein
MKDVYPNSNLERFHAEENSLERRDRERLATSPKNQIPSNLLDLVPEFSKVDPLVRVYLDTFEKTYRILHIPSFLKDYDTFWETPQHSPPGFIAVLLMVIATVNCAVNEPDGYELDGAVVRNEAVSWILACDDWQKQQSQKHRFMAMYQVMALRVLAVSANCLKTKVAYIGTESMLTYFKAAGMHQDPNVLEDRCSPFDGEMRRRLWWTAMELELQASIDRGTPSALSGFSNNCREPLNVDDEDFVPDMRQLPLPKPSSQCTSTSYLSISSKTLSLRIALCKLVNDPNSQLSHEDVLHYEQEINESLDKIPKWSDPGNLQASALFELQLRQFLYLIHMPFARQRDSLSSRYSRMICFEASKDVLDLHSKLIASGNMTLMLTREDIFRAALALCHISFLCTLKPSEKHSLNRALHDS